MLRKITGDWPRREHFQHYWNRVRCTYSLTVQIDITGLREALRAGGYRAYPAQVYLLAATVNRFPAFRMGLTEDGEPGIWDLLYPSYTIFHPETETFSSIWTPYDASFPQFYRACTADMEQYAGAGAFAPKTPAPPNLFDISSVPWLDFTAFNLNVYTEGTHLAPIFTIGQYNRQGPRTWMPLAMQLHHAACDGYHAGQFVAALRELAQGYRQWLG